MPDTIQRKFIVLPGGGGVTAVTADAPLAITGAPATPNVIISGAGATPGDALVWNGVAWVPGVGAGAGCLVWPLGVPWSAMITSLAAIGDAAVLLVEGDPTGAPRQITGKPDGMGGYLAQDFSHVIFMGAAADGGPSNTVVVELGLGATLNPGVLRSRDIMWAPLFPDIVSGPTAAYDVDLDGGGITPPGPLGGGSVFRAATSNGPNSMRLRNGAILDGTNLAPTDECISRIRPGFNGEVVLTIESYGGKIGVNSFINFVPPIPNPPFPFPTPVNGVVSMNMDAKTTVDPAYQAAFSTPPPHSNVIIQQLLTERDTSALIAYDDVLVAPPLNVDNVQDAIDALKSRSLTNTVFVSKTGDDATSNGAITSPFLTIQAAMEYAWTTYVVPVGPQPASPFTRPCVFVSAGTYDDGPLVLPPQICVLGEGFNHSRIVGAWTIDDRWSNYAPPSLPSPPSVLVPNDFRSSWNNVGLFGTINFDFNTVFSNEGKIYAFGCRFADDFTIAEKRVNPVSNSLTCTACEFLANVTLIGIPTIFESCVTRGGKLTLQQAIGTVFVDVDNVFESSGGSLGDIEIFSMDGTMPPYDCKFSHAQQPETTLILSGPFSTVKADIGAVPLQSAIPLFGGATLNQITLANQPNFSGILRPALPYEGQQFFDTSLGANGKPIWYSVAGGFWIDATGAGPV